MEFFLDEVLRDDTEMDMLQKKVDFNICSKYSEVEFTIFEQTF